MAQTEKIRCRVTDTKKAILDAYTSHLKDINEKSQGSLDPVKVQEEKKHVELVKRVAPLATLDIPSTVVALQNSVTSSLTAVLSTLDEKRKALADLDAVISAKNAELQELYGIEKAASSLAALIESHKEMANNLQIDHDEMVQELEDARAEARKTFETQKKAWSEELATIRNGDNLARQREREAYNYTFEREKAMRMDKLNDEIAKTEADIKVRLDAVTAREAKVTELETLVKTLEAKLVTECEKARSEATAQAKASADTAAKFVKLAHDSAIERLNDQLETANKRTADLLISNEKLQASLEAAHEKVQKMASEALQAGANAKQIADLQRLAETTSRNSK